MEKDTKWYIAIVIVGFLLIGYGEFTKSQAKTKERVILQDPEIMQNYRRFQSVAAEKGIAHMEPTRAKAAVTWILLERDQLLAKKAPGCKLEYRAGAGITSAYFEPIRAECDRRIRFG